MTDPRRAGRDAYWSGMTLDQNPETGIARALWINGWERARALDDEYSTLLGFDKLPPRSEPEPRAISPAKALFLTSRNGMIRFVPTEWVCATTTE